MADEIRKIINVETDRSVSNVERLNASLEEANQTAKDLKGNTRDFGGAYEESAQLILENTDKLDPALKSLGSDVRGMIPLIKEVNKSAIGGLTGIKAGIASTGIGALIIAVGLLITNFDKVRQVVGITDEQFNNFKNTVLDGLGKVISTVVGVGNVIMQHILAPVHAATEAFKGLGNIALDVFKGNFDAIKKHANEAFNNVKKVVIGAYDVEANYKIGQEYGRKFMNGLSTIFSDEKEEKKKIKESAAKIGKDIGKEIVEKAQEEIKENIYGDDFTTELEKAYAGMLEKLHSAEMSALDEEYRHRKELMDAATVDADNWNQEQYEMDQEYYSRKIELLEEYLDKYEGTIEERNKLENTLDRYKATLSQNEEKRQEHNVKKSKKAAEEKKKQNEVIYGAMADVAASTFGSISSMMEEGSEEQKAFSVMETVINTITGAIAAYKSLASIPIVGPALGAAAAAAVAATGAVAVSNIVSTTKDNAASQLGASAGSSGSSVSNYTDVSSLQMAGVSPLLNQYSDVSNMMALESSQDAGATRVYVLESDIRDVSNKVQVRENNATF